jgi:hypothetical protein
LANGQAGGPKQTSAAPKVRQHLQHDCAMRSPMMPQIPSPVVVVDHHQEAPLAADEEARRAVT